MALSLSIAPEPASTTAHTNTRHRSVRIWRDCSNRNSMKREFKHENGYSDQRGRLHAVIRGAILTGLKAHGHTLRRLP